MLLLEHNTPEVFATLSLFFAFLRCKPVQNWSSPYITPWRHREGIKVHVYYFFNLGARWEWVVNVTPRPHYPRQWTGTQSTGCGVDSRARLDGCGKFAPPGFDSRTVQPLASRYTGYAIPAHGQSIRPEKVMKNGFGHVCVTAFSYSAGSKFPYVFAWRVKGKTISYFSPHDLSTAQTVDITYTC